MSHLAIIRQHVDTLLATGRAYFGPDPTAMWMSSLDPRTGRYPADDRRPEAIPKRVYRNIDAPRGCSLYWDQPAIVATHALSSLTGDARYSQAADAYVRDFLDRCLATNGIMLWGNHYYWDAFRGKTVRFGGNEEPQPCDFATEDGLYHETRPIPPAWETFWRVSPEATERAIRAMAAGHIVDEATGCFNRHADPRPGCAFLEAGGILVESLCWLAARTGDRTLVDRALKVAGYSYAHRDPTTGLLENNPTETRWDKFVCTTEIGVWANSLLRAADYVGEPAFAEMADAATAPWLRYGYDAAANRYVGQLRIADGTPVREPRTTPYQPGEYASFWTPLFPIHDYPFCLAESCVALSQRTGKPIYREAIGRWVGIIADELPANGGKGAYAEHYGRCLHFLLGAARADERAARLATNVADEAIATLHDGKLFRTHPGEHRYDAVDGLGMLFLALIAMETGQEPPLLGFGF